ncbi:unnamed protein product [Fraxinus pennsylvanica]|uniref:Uncharacterized protein n=1 Tax=Fraxinus pennsylvanica TaxID=56036 RepID=A0AAD2A5I7_9LAMI|nr:unnamed protein product [Fraxinus pennsylvanica]
MIENKDNKDCADEVIRSLGNGETGKVCGANLHVRHGRTVLILRPGMQTISYLSLEVKPHCNTTMWTKLESNVKSALTFLHSVRRLQSCHLKYLPMPMFHAADRSPQSDRRRNLKA